MQENFDFIAIGDMATDAFIRLKDARVNCRIDSNECEISMKFADKVPYEFVEIVKAVGNSPNAAVSASRLGLKTALVSNLGKDSIASESVLYLKEQRVDTRFIKEHEGMKSNYHYVLWYEKDRTILVKHEEYPYQFPDIGEPKWIYLSSLGEKSLLYHQQIEKYLQNHPRVRLAFQPGTFQMKMGVGALRSLYERTYIFFCNVEEAKRILNTKEEGIGNLLKEISKLGPKIVVITDGPKGAYAYDGETMWFMPPFPDLKEAYERTGAGDAFASTVTAALALGKTLPEALMWGPINAGAVVQEIGAQKGLLYREKLEELLKIAPENYKPQKLV